MQKGQLFNKRNVQDGPPFHQHLTTGKIRREFWDITWHPFVELSWNDCPLTPIHTIRFQRFNFFQKLNTNVRSHSPISSFLSSVPFIFREEYISRKVSDEHRACFIAIWLFFSELLICVSKGHFCFDQTTRFSWNWIVWTGLYYARVHPIWDRTQEMSPFSASKTNQDIQLKNSYMKTTILRTLRLKFSFTYHLNIRCSLKQELSPAWNSRFLYTVFYCTLLKAKDLI